MIIQNKSESDLIDYMISFEELMGGEKWLKSNLLNELLLMAKYTDESLQYPKEPKVFVDYKNDKEELKPYSEIISPKKIKVQSLIKQKQVYENIDNIKFESDKFKEFKNELKEKGLEKLPEELHEPLIKKITEIFDTNRESKRKLSKKGFSEEYEWYVTISNWIGVEKAKQLYEKLNNRKAE